jgi:hypothetical protein
VTSPPVCSVRFCSFRSEGMSSTVRSPRSNKRKAVDSDPSPAPKSPRKTKNGKTEEVADTKNQNVIPKPADPTHSNKMHTLLIRTVTGLVMMFGFILIMFSNHAIISAFVVLLQIMVYREMTSLRYREAKEKDIPLFRSLNWCVILVSQSVSLPRKWSNGC